MTRSGEMVRPANPGKGFQMAKVDTVKGKEVKVLENVTGDQAPAVIPQKAVGENAEKAKKNKLIDVIYLNAQGKEVENGETPAGLRVMLTGEAPIDLAFNDLPKPMLFQAVAFGLNTTLRNAHNSTAHAGGDGKAALRARIASIKGGEWRSTGDGSDDGTPLVIEAMIRAKKDANAYENGMEEKWLTAYRSLDKAGKAEWTKTMSAKRPIAVALLQIKAERAQAKALAAAQGSPSAGEDF